MKAVRLHRLGGPEVLEVEEIPDPVPGPLELLVAVEATSINRRDLWMRAGHPHPAYHVHLPAILGIDLCGHVVATGEEADEAWVGQRITINPYVTCGRCEYCRRERSQYCMSFDVYHGTYAELAVVPQALAVPVAAEVPAEHVACFANAYITAWEMLVTKAGVGPEDVVFVWAGTSGLGSAGIDIARLHGARVIASAGSEAKLAELAGLGPDMTVDHHQDDVVARVNEFTGGLGASIVFEHVGHATWERSLALCASGGTIVSAGATSGDDVTMDVTAMFVKQVRILGSRLGTMDDALSAARHLNSGAFAPLIAEVLPLDGVAEGHRRLEQGDAAGKLV
ncbi:MAG: zinc-binding dehydrogenase, partial [Solirubrobacteraceae bacterium]